MKTWVNKIDRFISLANRYEVRMLLVGGGAVNFHGYHRHSADVDFWIEATAENFKRLVRVFKAMDYAIEDFPEAVKSQRQNISVKFSPEDLNLELISQFSTQISFKEAYERSESVSIKDQPVIKWRVLSYDDLITSKLKTHRAKDLLDVQALQKIHNNRD